MMRPFLTLCCLGLLGGAIAAVVPETNERFADSVAGVVSSPQAPSADVPSDDRHLDRQHPLPLLADADETDDGEELSGREKAAAHYAGRYGEAGPSPRTARFQAAIQPRLASTLNALGVRLQI